MSQAVNAQMGSVLVGGNINLSSNKVPSSPNDIKETSLDFNPTIGYQFSNNWTAGLVADIKTIKYTGSANTVSKDNSFGIGPFVRYTKNLSNVFAVYGQLQGVFGSANNGGSKSTQANVSAFPAIFINVKNGFGLNFTVGGIGYSSTKPSGERATSSFNLTFGQSVGIGISKNFGTGKKK